MRERDQRVGEQDQQSAECAIQEKGQQRQTDETWRTKERQRHHGAFAANAFIPDERGHQRATRDKGNFRLFRRACAP